MSCASIDLKAYLLGEASNEERRVVEQHLPACNECREEVERLGIMQTALMSLREEEIPRRIAFVSDKVFEPRWYQKLWNSGPAAGFASATVLAGAILAHGLMQPPTPSSPAAAEISQSVVEAKVEAELGKRLDAAVLKAVGDRAAQQEAETTSRLAAVRREMQSEQLADRLFYQENMRVLHKRIEVLTKSAVYASASFGERQ